MAIINIHAAKTHLSRLIEQADSGREVIIAKAGRPLVRLVPFRPSGGKRQLGVLAGRVRAPADFDAPLAESLLAPFEGR